MYKKFEFLFIFVHFCSLFPFLFNVPANFESEQKRCEQNWTKKTIATPNRNLRVQVKPTVKCDLFDCIQTVARIVSTLVFQCSARAAAWMYKQRGRYFFNSEASKSEPFGVHILRLKWLVVTLAFLSNEEYLSGSCQGTFSYDGHKFLEPYYSCHGVHACEQQLAT